MQSVQLSNWKIYLIFLSCWKLEDATKYRAAGFEYFFEFLWLKQRISWWNKRAAWSIFIWLPFTNWIILKVQETSTKSELGDLGEQKIIKRLSSQANSVHLEHFLIKSCQKYFLSSVNSGETTNIISCWPLLKIQTESL